MIVSDMCVERINATGFERSHSDNAAAMSVLARNVLALHEYL